MKIVAFDDNQKELHELYQMVTSWSQNRQYPDVIVKTFTEGSDLRFSLPDFYQWDVFFLDIMTPDDISAGFRSAEAIRKYNSSARIIFTTASREYIENAFEISAFRYMLKPLKQEKIWETLDHIYESALTDPAHSAVFPGFDTKMIIEYDRILRIQAYTSNHLARVFLTTGDSFDISLNLISFSDIIEELLNQDFVRCHQSHIINMNHIKAYTSRQATLRDSSRVPVSRREKEAFFAAVIEHYKGIQ